MWAVDHLSIETDASRAGSCGERRDNVACPFDLGLEHGNIWLTDLAGVVFEGRSFMEASLGNARAATAPPGPPPGGKPTPVK